MTVRDNPEKSFPIVGIGASAGGLKAFESFLAALPRDFGFALVFVQHLSARHKSILPDLLEGRRPDLEVVEIVDNERVLPGRLYLCPPGNEVRIRNGTFHVAPGPEGHTHYPIDEFFESMAEAAGERATAVVLSGAGTDGARGIHAVRTAGGCVFVQEPETAEFPGMPLAAIDAGEVDGVFPPEGIAAEILKLRKADEKAASHDAPLTPEEYETFYRLIQERTGHRFVHYKKSVVSRRIRRRMYLGGVTSVQDYLALVAGKDSEARALAYDLMIGVTSFFRDRVAWKALNQDVVRKLAQEDTDVPLRVWTPACATGEESYSIALTLLEALALHGKRRDIQVFATDVNDAALERAREGKYPASIAADVPQEYLQKYFKTSEDGQSIIVTKGVRERVIFAKQDLLTDPPFSRLDLVICRNLLIYLEPDAQDKCLALFHYALKPGGYLFLGNAESAGRNRDIFKALGHKKCRIYQKEEAKPSARLQVAVPFAAERAQAIIAKQSLSAEQQLGVIGLVQEALIEEYAPAAIAIDRNYDIVYHNGPTNQYLSQPRGVPTRNLLELLPVQLANRIRSALYRAASEEKPVSIRASVPGEDDKKRQVTLRVTKIGDNLYLVVFRRKTEAGPEAEIVLSESPAAVEEAAVRQLETELATTRTDLQSHIEQLKSLNEELQSSNEELQAANEELETSREELQSLNEELITVNSQLQEKIEEQDVTNNDLNNFLASTNIPTIFLDTHFRVKRFTPAMLKLIKLLPSDVGRPIVDMSQENLGPDLIANTQAVLETLVPITQDIRINGTWYVRTTLPYRTADNRIEGVVITYNDVTELKRAEERTRHLASFPQLNPNPVIEVNASGTVIFANPGTERILESLGLDKGEVVVFLPKDMDVILKDLDKNSGSAVSREVSVKGRVFSETVQLVPQFKAARIYAYDITERKKAEEAQGRLSAIVASAEDAIISKDLDGVIRTWNVGAEKIFGYTAEEAIGKHVSFLVPPRHADEVSDILRRMSIGEHIENFETVRMRKDGTIIPVSLNFSAIRDSNGKVIGASKIAHDITERKRAELLLRRAADFDEAVMKSLGEGLYTIDEKGLVSSMNPAAEELLGWTFAELRGKKMHDMTHHHHRDGRQFPSSECAGFQVLTTGVPLKNHEDVFIHKDGTFFDVTYSIAPLRDNVGKINGLVVVFSDITDRKKAEEALRESEERVRLKLDSILSPEGDIGNLELGDIIDPPALQSLVDNLYKFVHLPIGIIDLKGKVLVGVGWQDICTKFHRIHPDTCRHCMESDLELTKGVSPGEFKLYKCKNGMWDAVTPFMVGGQHMGNLFWGQFFFDDEPVDREFFRAQAGKYGFDKEEYLAALDKVPRISREALNTGMAFYLKLADMLSKLSYSNIKLAQTLSMRDTLLHSLRESEERLKRSQEISRLGSWELDLVNNRLFWSDEVYRIFGLQPQEFDATYEAFLERVYPDDREEVNAAYSGSLRDNRDTYEIEHRVTRQDTGETRIVHEKCEHFRDPSGRIIRSVGMVHDITDRKKAEAEILKLSEDMTARNAQLEDANKELESFIYSVSHDLRAPLRSVSEFARIVAEDYSDKLDAQGIDYLSRVSKGSAKMSRLIESLLYLSRISRQDLVRSSVDMGKVAETIIAELRAANSGRKVEVDIKEGMTAFADPRLMEVALSNILGNAWKFTSKTPNARIEFGTIEREFAPHPTSPRKGEALSQSAMRNPKSEMVYFVRDNGAGFDEKYAEKMFWPFQRLHSDEEFEGTGIGLTIVERVIRRHGGKIWAEGEPGKGATVYFTLG